MPTITSRVTLLIDRALGYLGLFLIGLIGWVCDHFGPIRTGDRRAPSGRHEHAGLSRK